TRGGRVESQHRGTVAITDAAGENLLCLGDVAEPVYPRSAIKALQCLPVLESGAADHFGFAASEIALCCASHSGTAMHADLAREILRHAGLDEAALACGAHLPVDEGEARQMLRAGRQPNRFHNNCSGKHAGMLATAQYLGEPTEGYHRPDHPVQHRIEGVLQSLTGARLAKGDCAIDGCSAPNWAIPIGGLSYAFAQFISGTGAMAEHNEAGRRIAENCWAKPEFVAGEGRPDTRLLRRFANEVFIKTGAEGVYCGAIRSSGIGFALKIEDGAGRASEMAMRAIVSALVDGAADVAEERVITNWDGLEVGTLRVAEGFRKVLAATRA
ncbi:MAG: asparaginase, partial [Hyphomicrobiaceae bacterium]